MSKRREMGKKGKKYEPATTASRDKGRAGAVLGDASFTCNLYDQPVARTAVAGPASEIDPRSWQPW